MMSDDLVIAEAFEPHERAVVADAHVVVQPPRTVRDLYRRRVRAVTGNAQASAAGLQPERAVTSPSTLLRVVAATPALLVKLPVFLAMTVAGRVGARRAIRDGDFETWRRDESSRGGPHQGTATSSLYR
jgi:hypothetical protein